MTAPVLFRDLAPYVGELTTEDEAWLAGAARLDPRDYRIGIAADEPSDDDWSPLVERGPDGNWWAGRFIGSITVNGRRLVIEPRLGISVIEKWLDQAFGLLAPPVSATHVGAESFILRLMARLWCRSVDNATKHGLPLLRLPHSHEGIYARGRIDPLRTARLIGEGKQAVASITHERSLAHPATRAIVCAERALAEKLASSTDWRTERVREVLPHLRAGVGARPRLPTLHEIGRVRYTPITLPFKQLALLSHRLASRLGYGATSQPGAAEGILVDVAELWELFLLNCARQAVPVGTHVEHGTQAGRRDYLLRSETSGKEIARIKPDLLITRAGQVCAIIDAKYKRLHNTRERPYGIDQADLYQLVSYAMRFNPTQIAMLAYPLPDPMDESGATAEAEGPWRTDRQVFTFERLPTDAEACREALTAHLAAAAG